MTTISNSLPSSPQGKASAPQGKASAAVKPNPVLHIVTVLSGLMAAFLGKRFGSVGLEAGGFIVAATPSAAHYAAAIFELYWHGPHTRAAMIADVEAVAKEAAADLANNPEFVSWLKGVIQAEMAKSGSAESGQMVK